MRENNQFQVLLDHISSIREERDTQKRMEMLLQLNDSLPARLHLQMPSLITNAYVRRALDLIEERVSLMVAMNENTLASSTVA